MEGKANVQDPASVRDSMEKAIEHGIAWENDQQDTAFWGKGKGKKGEEGMKGKDSFKGMPSRKGKKGKGDGKNKGGNPFQQQR